MSSVADRAVADALKELVLGYAGTGIGEAEATAFLAGALWMLPDAKARMLLQLLAVVLDVPEPVQQQAIGAALRKVGAR